MFNSQHFIVIQTPLGVTPEHYWIWTSKKSFCLDSGSTHLYFLNMVFWHQICICSIKIKSPISLPPSNESWFSSYLRICPPSVIGRVLKNGCYKSFLTDSLLEVTNAETFGEDSLDLCRDKLCCCQFFSGLTGVCYPFLL